jgi:hypothetical protein
VDPCGLVDEAFQDSGTLYEGLYLFAACLGYLFGSLSSAPTLCLPGRLDLFFSEGAQGI